MYVSIVLRVISQLPRVVTMAISVVSIIIKPNCTPKHWYINLSLATHVLRGLVVYKDSHKRPAFDLQMLRVLLGNLWNCRLVVVSFTRSLVAGVFCKKADLCH